MPALNVFWVGPPATGKYKGHDTVGVDLFRDKYPEQEIHFYCLDEEVQHYTTCFNTQQATKRPVVIHGIEATVESVDTPHRQAFLDFIALTKKRIAAFDDPKAKIQELVGLKDAFAHYFSVLVSYGGAKKGYAIDSNVMPTDAFTEPLREHDDFSAAFIFDERLSDWRADPWLMYVIGDAAADGRFDAYLKQVSEYLALCQEEGEFVSRGEMIFTTDYGELSAHTLISSQFAYGARDAKSLEASHPPDNYLNNDELVINGGCFIKRYNNSHAVGSTLEGSPILHRIAEGSISSKAELLYFLKLNELDGLDNYEYEISAPMLARPMTAETNLFKRVTERGRHDIGALLLSLSRKDEAIDKAIYSSPGAKCLEQYIDLRLTQLCFDSANFFSQLSQLLNVTDKILGKPEAERAITTIDELCATLRQSGVGEDISAVKAFKMMMFEGPLSADNLSAYTDKLYELYQAHKPGYSPALFTEASSPETSREDIREMMEAILPSNGAQPST